MKTNAFSAYFQPCFQPSWGHLGTTWAPSWSHLVPTWEPCWATFGHQVAHFGDPRAHSCPPGAPSGAVWLPMGGQVEPFGSPWGAKWSRLAPHGEPCGALWLPMGSPGVQIGGLWAPIGAAFGTHRPRIGPAFRLRAQVSHLHNCRRSHFRI